MDVAEYDIWIRRYAEHPFRTTQLDYLFAYLSCILFNAHAQDKREVHDFLLWENRPTYKAEDDPEIMALWCKGMEMAQEKKRRKQLHTEWEPAAK